MSEFVARIVLELVCGLTGHAVLWVVTLGRWRPFESMSDDAATLVGLLFWVGVGMGVWMAFFA